MPHLLIREASVYNGHLWGPVTLTPIAERLAVDCHYPFLRLRSVAAGIDSNMQLSACGANALTPFAIAAVTSNGEKTV